MSTFRSLLRIMIDKRWVRYLVGVMFPLIGVLVGALAITGTAIHEVSGTIHTVVIERDSHGAYQDHLITLDGATTHYNVGANYFTPALAEDVFGVGQRVDLWYEERPLFDPDVLALRVYDASGAATRYTTSAYTDPAGTRRGDLITAGVFVLLGVLALIAAIWLPVPGEAGRIAGPASGKAPANYGEMVVGPRRQPPGAGDAR
jgi:hypothetical protein